MSNNGIVGQKEFKGPIRVLYVTHSSTLTGANRSLLDLIAALDKQQVQPIVLLRKSGPLVGELNRRSIQYYSVRYANAFRSPHGVPKFAKRVLNRLALLRLKSIIRKLDIDIVHNNSLLADLGMQAAHECNVPFVCHIRELVEEDHGLAFLDGEKTKRLAQYSTKAIAISQFVANKFKSWFPEGQMTIMPNGLNIEEYGIQHDTLLASSPARILLAGRFAVGKGQMEAIQAVELLKRQGRKLYLTLVGGPGNLDYRNECIEYVNEHNLGDCIEILDFTEDLKILKSSADISLTCSHNEALGRVTIEGMLAGCIVIGAAAGATTEIISEKESGLLYSVGSYEDLAEKIEWVLDNPGFARKIAYKGQTIARVTYDSFEYSKKIIALYQDVLCR